MSEDGQSPLAIIMGSLALMVVFYRIIYIGYPMFLSGYQKGNITTIFKAFTTLV